MDLLKIHLNDAFTKKISSRSFPDHPRHETCFMRI